MPSGSCYLEIQWAEVVDNFTVRCLACKVEGDPVSGPFAHKVDCPVAALERLADDDGPDRWEIIIGKPENVCTYGTTMKGILQNDGGQ